MLPFFKKKRFDRYAGVAKRLEKDDAVVDINQLVVGGVQDQGRRRIGSDVEFIRKLPDLRVRR